MPLTVRATDIGDVWLLAILKAKACDRGVQLLTNIEASTVGGVVQVKHIDLGGVIRVHHLCLLEELHTCTCVQAANKGTVHVGSVTPVPAHRSKPQKGTGLFTTCFVEAYVSVSVGFQ